MKRLKYVKCLHKHRSHWTNISNEKFADTPFVVYVLIYPLSKFGGNRTNSLWVLALYNVRFKRKNWLKKIAKYVYQTGNFYFLPKIKTANSLSIFNLFQWFLLFIRDFIWIITLSEKIEIWRKLPIWRYTVTLQGKHSFKSELCKAREMGIQLGDTDTKLHIRERVLNFWRMRWVPSIHPDDIQYLNLRLVSQFNLGKRLLQRFAISWANFVLFCLWWLVRNRLSINGNGVFPANFCTDSVQCCGWKNKNEEQKR